jgi:hypothetical protein
LFCPDQLKSQVWKRPFRVAEITSIWPLDCDVRALTEAIVFRIDPPRRPLKLKKLPPEPFGALKTVVAMLGLPWESRKVSWASLPLLKTRT